MERERGNFRGFLTECPEPQSLVVIDNSTSVWEFASMFWYYGLSIRLMHSIVGSCMWGDQKYIVHVAQVTSNRLANAQTARVAVTFLVI